MCMIEDGEPCDVWIETAHRARKEHKCEECYRMIMPGEMYRRIFMVSDGHARTSKMCAHCTKAAGLLVEQCGGYAAGGVLEDLTQHCEWLNEYQWSRQAARHVVAMRRKWRRFDGTGLMELAS